MTNKLIKQKLNEIEKVRKAYRKTYHNYVEEFNELNKRFVKLAKEVDELFGVMETVVEMQNEK